MKDTVGQKQILQEFGLLTSKSSQLSTADCHGRRVDATVVCAKVVWCGTSKDKDSNGKQQTGRQDSSQLQAACALSGEELQNSQMSSDRQESDSQRAHGQHLWRGPSRKPRGLGQPGSGEGLHHLTGTVVTVKRTPRSASLPEKMRRLARSAPANQASPEQRHLSLTCSGLQRLFVSFRTSRNCPILYTPKISQLRTHAAKTGDYEATQLPRLSADCCLCISPSCRLSRS